VGFVPRAPEPTAELQAKGGLAAVTDPLLDAGSVYRYHRKLAKISGVQCGTCSNYLTLPAGTPCRDCEHGRAFAAAIMETGDIPEDFERANGTMICRICGLEYYAHPASYWIPSMHRICPGHWPREGKPDLLWVKT
jgi:hypothetical protein